MNRYHKRILAAAAVVTAAAIASYWYWSPYIAVRELRDAALNADAERFNEHVDFPRLRASLKGQFSERIGGGIGGMLALALADKMIDVAVRPETIMFAMREGKFKVGNTGTGTGDGNRDPGERKQVAWRTERQGFNTVLFHAEGGNDRAGKDRMALVMQREGFANWKLTDIRLPDPE